MGKEFLSKNIESLATESELAGILGPRLKTEAPASNLVALLKSHLTLFDIISFLPPSSDNRPYCFLPKSMHNDSDVMHQYYTRAY